MRNLVWLGMLLVVFVSGGATCARRDPHMAFPAPPPVLEQTPTADELAALVNRTDAIHELSTNSASVDVLSMPGVPQLGATMHLQRDRNFRLRAHLPVVFGAGVDMGSNDQLFWFEVPEGMSKTLYYARHEEYRQQLHRAILPVDPTWLIDAIGLVHLDPQTIVAGPVERADGLLEVRSTMDLPDGTYQRVCYVDPEAAYVTRQFLYAPDGRLIATAEASEHRYYEEHQCALPHRVRFELTPAAGPPLAMQIEIGSYAVNQLLSSDPQLFSMPESASQAVDLTTLTPPGASTAPAASPVGRTADAASRYTTGSAGYVEDAPASMPLRGTTR